MLGFKAVRGMDGFRVEDERFRDWVFGRVLPEIELTSRARPMSCCPKLGSKSSKFCCRTAH